MGHMAKQSCLHHPVMNPSLCPPGCGRLEGDSILRNTLATLTKMDSVAAPFYSSTQPGAHALPTLTGLGQPTPHHPTQGHTSSLQQQQHQPQQPPLPPAGVPPQSQVPGYSLPTLGQAMQHQSPTTLNAEREREMREREARDRDARDRLRQQDEIAQHERDLQREHDIRERQQREQQQSVPLQSQAGSIPIHQPVASRVQTTIHGPNGLLSHLGTSSSVGPPITTMSMSNGPSNVFGTPIPPNESTPRTFVQQPGPGAIPQQQMMGFGATPGPHLLPGGVAALPQGQQPILNVSAGTPPHKRGAYHPICSKLRQGLVGKELI